MLFTACLLRHRYSHGACEDLVLAVPRFALVTLWFEARTQQGDGRRFDFRTTSIVTSRLCIVFPLTDSWTTAPIEFASSVFASGSHRIHRNDISFSSPLRFFWRIVRNIIVVRQPSWVRHINDRWLFTCNWYCYTLLRKKTKT